MLMMAAARILTDLDVHCLFFQLILFSVGVISPGLLPTPLGWQRYLILPRGQTALFSTNWILRSMQTIAELAKKWGQLDLKFESLAELKFDPGFRVIEEYLSQKDSMSSQFDSTLSQIGKNGSFFYSEKKFFSSYSSTSGNV